MQHELTRHMPSRCLVLPSSLVQIGQVSVAMLIPCSFGRGEQGTRKTIEPGLFRVSSQPVKGIIFLNIKSSNARLSSLQEAWELRCSSSYWHNFTFLFIGQIWKSVFQRAKHSRVRRNRGSHRERGGTEMIPVARLTLALADGCAVYPTYVKVFIT